MSAILLSLTLLGAAAQVQTRETPTTRLFVQTTPPGAAIKLDGKAEGTAPKVFLVLPGATKMIVEIELDGHASQRREVTIQGGRVTRIEFQLEPKRTTQQAKASAVTLQVNRIHLPSAKGHGELSVLDLASGQTLALSDEGARDAGVFTRMGKGDLLFEDELYCLRGARAECLEPEGFPAFRVDEKHKEVTGYKLPKTPCPLRITTKENRRFDVTILAVTKDGGIDLEYRLADPGTGAAAPANQDWPEVERILYTDMSGKECGIDLDTGKLYAVPKEYNRVVYPRDEIVRWAKDHHIDLFYPANPRFGHLTCVGLGQRAFDNTTWEKVTREDVRDFFTRLGAGKMETPDTMTSLWADNATGAAPSYVYAFVTNEGSRGIVQIVGTVGPYEDGSPSGVKIRYKIERAVEALKDEVPAAGGSLMGATSGMSGPPHSGPPETGEDAGAKEPAPPGVSPAAELKTLQAEWKVLRVEKGEDADRSWAAICQFGFGSGLAPETTHRLDFRANRGYPLSVRRCSPPSISTPSPLPPLSHLPPWYDQGFEYRIDPAATPKTFDLFQVYPAGEKKRPAAQGIYQIDGDRLKICLTKCLPTPLLQEHIQRPNRFAIENSSADILFVLERYRPPEDEKALQGFWDIIWQVTDGVPVPEENRRVRRWSFHDDYAFIYERGGPVPFVLDPLKRKETQNVQRPSRGSAAKLPQPTSEGGHDEDVREFAPKENGPWHFVGVVTEVGGDGTVVISSGEVNGIRQDEELEVIHGETDDKGASRRFALVRVTSVARTSAAARVVAARRFLDEDGKRFVFDRVKVGDRVMRPVR